MKTKLMLQLWFWFVIALLGWATVTASMTENVVDAFGRIWADPWGKATLIDAYAGFFAFYIWILSREKSTLSRLAWLVILCGTGNFGMAGYALWQIRKMNPDDTLSSLLSEKRG